MGRQKKECVGIRKIYNDRSFWPRRSVSRESSQSTVWVMPFLVLAQEWGPVPPGLRTSCINLLWRKKKETSLSRDVSQPSVNHNCSLFIWLSLSLPHTAVSLQISNFLVIRKRVYIFISKCSFQLHPCYTGRCLHGVMVKAMDSGIVVSEFKLQSCYYVHFRANTLGKGMNPLILPAMG